MTFRYPFGTHFWILRILVHTISIYGCFWNLLMGALFTHLETFWQSFHRDSAILILGLDNAGKTATLYAMKLGEAIEYTVPTIGFNLEEVSIGNINIKMWDIGGQDSLRKLWPHYFGQTDGIVFVVDSADIERFTLVKEELHTLMSHKDLNEKPFLILANKQDLPSAATKGELIETLELNKVSWLPWYVIECSATNNGKARVGFEWLAGQI